jgi:choline dehydrogenase-like flavoprotein
MGTHSYDAIVVGTGISGGWAAKALTEKGLTLLGFFTFATRGDAGIAIRGDTRRLSRLPARQPGRQRQTVGNMGSGGRRSEESG